jgi:BirA family biotin operon repressor/biotin-[acetyl-CoA-carboxylase] ligase
VTGADVESLLHTRLIARPLVFRETIDSTNTLARELADAGAGHGTTVLAARQSAGRGRRGRTWSALPGDQLFTSVVLRPRLPIERVFELTLVAAVSVADALVACGADPRIKWPNDVELDGRKVAGILADLATGPDGGMQHLVLGIGVNVSGRPADLPEELRERATTIEAALGIPPPAARVAAEVYAALERWLDRHAADGLAPVLAAWRARSSTLGATVRATLDGRDLTGRAEEIDDTGALLIRSNAGDVVRIRSGEVITLRRH